MPKKIEQRSDFARKFLSFTLIAGSALWIGLVIVVMVDVLSSTTVNPATGSCESDVTLGGIITTLAVCIPLLGVGGAYAYYGARDLYEVMIGNGERGFAVLPTARHEPRAPIRFDPRPSGRMLPPMLNARRSPGATPAALGYRFPAEWELHAATWFSWPRPEGISFPDKYETVPPVLAEIIRHIAPRERVCINVPNEAWGRTVHGILQSHGVPTENVRYFYIPTNENWCRDHGPAFVVRPGTEPLAVVDWGFNAWGGKYPPYGDDDDVPIRVAEILNLLLFQPKTPGGRGVVMEGGAVDFNGAGTVLTTESCLLNPNRNTDLSKLQIEQYLKDYYGQTHVCWLGDGIAGDDTDGHIDDLARFLDPRTIVTTVEDDPADANYAILQDNLERCKALRDQDGRPFEVVTLPMPGVVEHDGQRLPATYANFYFVNGAVLVPTYRHPASESRALDTLRARLPGREVIGIDCTELIWGLGAIHCLTQQQPAG